MKINYKVFTPYIVILLLWITGVLSFKACLWCFLAWIIVSIGAFAYGFWEQAYKRRQWDKFWQRYHSSGDEHNIYEDEQA
jgi:hypothetical protein